MQRVFCAIIVAGNLEKKIGYPASERHCCDFLVKIFQVHIVHFTMETGEWTNLQQICIWIDFFFSFFHEAVKNHENSN